MDQHDLTPQINHAVDVLQPVIDGIADDDWSRPTDCTDWDVRQVLNHTVGGMRIFAAELTGQGPTADHDSDWLGENPVHAFEVAAALDSAAWCSPLSPEHMVTISLGPLSLDLAAVIHLTELVAHGVDLARATGQEHLLDEELCARLLAAIHAMGESTTTGCRASSAQRSRSVISRPHTSTSPPTSAATSPSRVAQPSRP